MKKKILRNNSLLLSVAVLIFLISSCGKKEETSPSPQPQAPPAVKPKAQVQKQVSSAKTVNEIGSNVDFKVMKDPFKPYIADTKSAPAVKRDKFGQALPILNYEVAQFRISGIIVGLKSNSAMIVDPTGKPYVVKPGMEIGRNNGRITNITPTFIEVFEQYRDENGKLIKQNVRLTLPKKQ
jgi:type IV pilus assembly protein PilP